MCGGKTKGASRLHRPDSPDSGLGLCCESEPHSDDNPDDSPGVIVSDACQLAGRGSIASGTPGQRAVQINGWKAVSRRARADMQLACNTLEAHCAAATWGVIIVDACKADACKA